jgi:hypothetical protein
MIQQHSLRFSASTKPVNIRGPKQEAQCGRCGLTRRIRYRIGQVRSLGVCASCRDVLMLDGWDIDQISEHYGTEI